MPPRWTRSHACCFHLGHALAGILPGKCYEVKNRLIHFTHCFMIFYLWSRWTCFLSLRSQPGKFLEWHGFNKSVCTVILLREESWIWARTSLCILVIKQGPFHLGWNFGETPFLRNLFHTTSPVFIASPYAVWLKSQVCFSAFLLNWFIDWFYSPKKITYTHIHSIHMYTWIPHSYYFWQG